MQKKRKPGPITIKRLDQQTGEIEVVGVVKASKLGPSKRSPSRRRRRSRGARARAESDLAANREMIERSARGTKGYKPSEWRLK